MLKRIVFILFLTGSAGCLSAQGLKIVKDNINCTYGLKNEKSHWVLKAKYTLIQSTNTGYYLLTLDGKQGIADKRGKVLIKPVYDQISSFPYGNHIKWYPGKRSIPFDQVPVNHLFMVYNGNYRGLVHKTGKVLFAPKYENFRVDELPRIVLYQFKNNRYISTYADTSGKVILQNVDGYLWAFGASEVGLVSDDNSGSQNQRIIDRAGNVIIPKGHERVYHDTKTNRLVAIDGNERREFDLTGKELTPVSLRQRNRSIEYSLDTMEEISTRSFLKPYQTEPISSWTKTGILA